MAAATDFPTRGKVLASKDGMIAFNPRGTTYELHLKHAGEAPPLNTLIDVLVRGTARKVWTVPSGGNFITPIVGTPRIVQGRVKFMSDQQLVLHAGASFIIDLPRAESAVDLNNGAIALGTMVNVTLLPGASIEVVAARAAAAAT
jgi:hypothetical protein